MKPLGKASRQDVTSVCFLLESPSLHATREGKQAMGLLVWFNVVQTSPTLTRNNLPFFGLREGNHNKEP